MTDSPATPRLLRFLTALGLEPIPVEPTEHDAPRLFSHLRTLDHGTEAGIQERVLAYELVRVSDTAYYRGHLYLLTFEGEGSRATVRHNSEVASEDFALAGLSFGPHQILNTVRELMLAGLYTDPALAVEEAVRTAVHIGAIDWSGMRTELIRTIKERQDYEASVAEIEPGFDPPRLADELHELYEYKLGVMNEQFREHQVAILGDRLTELVLALYALESPVPVSA